jgi:outer membrane immunogenic protein
MKMTKLLVGSVALIGIVASKGALAADLPVYKPAPPIVYHNWTGSYVGVALGGKWGNASWTSTSTSDFPGTIVDASSPRDYGLSAFRIGAYAGYNHQIVNWLFGLEADIAWSDTTASAPGIPGCTILCFPGAPGPGIDVTSVRMGWDASLRGRVGHLLTSDLLLYATGGVAWQHVEASGTCQHSVADPACTVAPGDPLDTRTNNKTLTGWTLGGGVEKMFGSWLLRGEYRYSQFSAFNGVLDFQAPDSPAGTDFHRYRLSVHTHTATLGLAFKFGGPIHARY